jgi:hypothetical protein
MLASQNFIDCMLAQAKQLGISPDRFKPIQERFEGLRNALRTQGNLLGADAIASAQVLQEEAIRLEGKVRGARKTLEVYLDTKERIAEGATVTTSVLVGDGKKGGVGVGIARGAVSLISNDVRFKGLSYETNRDVTKNLLYSMVNDIVEKIGKGVLGVQKGTAHMPNIVDEIFGINTGDSAAKSMAIAWMKMENAAVDIFNAAGGSMRKLVGFHMPQNQNISKLVRDGEANYVKFHMEAGILDWDKMRWPNGNLIDPKDRESILKKVYLTKTTGGLNKISDTDFNGNAISMSNIIDQHRFLIYKDSKAWQAQHAKYGDGNVFDVMSSHIDDFSHRIAMVEMFGPNPDLFAKNVNIMVRKEASKYGAEAIQDASAVMKNKFDVLWTNVTRQNPMDNESVFGNLVTGTSNLLTSAQLASALLLAMPGDTMTKMAVRAFNKMDIFGGTDMYFKMAMTDRAAMQSIATQSGFVTEQVVSHVYGTARFSGLASAGPEVTKRISDTVMRASFMSGHTAASRWSAQAEFMGLLSRSLTQEFDTLPYVDVLKRYGIDKADWNDFRNNIKPWQPRTDVNFARPVDILQSNLRDKMELYRKFQGMILEESRNMVPEATVEASAFLRGNTRPDTVIGAILHSFAMYKNFPVSMQMIYGRLALSSPDVLTRVKFIAGLAAGMTAVGALGVQMREVSKGRDPMPMNDVKFWGKALLTGGSMGLMGDFLFGHVNQFGRSPAEAIGGPLVGLAADTTNLAFGDAFKWAESLGSLGDDEFKSNTASRAVQFAKKYTPGTSLWYARLALERQVWDRFEELADPDIYKKRRKAVKQQLEKYGNEYFYAPGDRSPERLPTATGILG